MKLWAPNSCRSFPSSCRTTHPMPLVPHPTADDHHRHSPCCRPAVALSFLLFLPTLLAVYLALFRGSTTSLATTGRASLLFYCRSPLHRRTLYDLRRHLEMRKPPPLLISPGISFTVLARSTKLLPANRRSIGVNSLFPSRALAELLPKVLLPTMSRPRRCFRFW